MKILFVVNSSDFLVKIEKLFTKICARPSPMNETLKQFQTLVEIVQKLRGPKGCPWDKEQTQKSLTQYALEETYELIEAIESSDQKHIQEELGDFLFQVILQAQVAEDEGHFQLLSVIQQLNEKLIRRHPHVFGDAQYANSQEVWKNWDRLKKLENTAPKPLFNYPKDLPALQAAYKIGVKTEGYEFDWDQAQEVLEKVHEEFNETKEALADYNHHPGGGKQALTHEIGDLLFSVAQLARHVDLEPEACLREANRRFEQRFNKVLKLSGLEKENFAALSKAEKEQLWNRAKKEISE